HMIVAAGRHPRRAEIAAAQVCAHGHIGGLPPERRIDQPDVDEVLPLSVAADSAYVLALPGIVEIRQAGVVELQIGAAELPQGLDLGSVNLGEVAPEFLQAGV